jgi:hypothetical protein
MTLSTHEIYEERSSLWWFWLLTYAGGEYMRGFTLPAPGIRKLESTRDQPTIGGDYLWRFEGEDEDRYKGRIERAHYERQAGAALDAIVAGVLEGVGPPTLPAKLEAMLLDVNARGTPWPEWRNGAATWAGNFGHVHVGAELPTAEGGLDRTPGLPFLYLITPLDMIDWKLDQWGAWDRAVVRESLPRNEGGRAVLGYRAWTKTEVMLLDEKGAVIPGSERVNPYGFVPIETLYYSADPIYSSQRIGRAWMESPARRNQHLYNVQSWIDQIAFRVTFPNLAYPVPPGESSVSPEQKKAVGVNTPLAFTQGAGRPFWLSPPRESIDVLRELARDDIRAIREMAGLASPEGPASGSAEMPSGEALRQLRANLGAILGQFARQLQAGDDRILKLAARVMGAGEDEVKVEYPESYADVDDTIKLDEAQRALDLGLEGVPTANAMILEHVLRTVLPGAEAEKLEEAVKEIEEQAKDEFEKPEPVPPVVPGQPPPPDEDQTQVTLQPGDEVPARDKTQPFGKSNAP